MRRLAFIKYLFSVASTQSTQPEPRSGISLLLFHDSVELFLHLASEHLDVGRSGINFLDYWDVINTEIEGEISMKESMRRLNRARASLKHHGLLPAQSEIERFSIIVSEFFRENVLKIFTLNFDNISMIDLIICNECKENLALAIKHYKDGANAESRKRLAASFAYLLYDYETRKRDEYGSSPYFFGGSFTFLRSHSLGMLAPDRLGEFVDATGESIELLRQAMKIMSFGINYRKYSKFKMLTPYSRIRPLAKGQTTVRYGRIQETELTQEDFDFCHNFIIESALHIQEFD